MSQIRKEYAGRESAEKRRSRLEEQVEVIAALEGRGWTRAHMAEAVGVSYDTARKWAASAEEEAGGRATVAFESALRPLREAMRVGAEPPRRNKSGGSSWKTAKSRPSRLLRQYELHIPARRAAFFARLLAEAAGGVKNRLCTLLALRRGTLNDYLDAGREKYIPERTAERAATLFERHCHGGGPRPAAQPPAGRPAGDRRTPSGRVERRRT